MDSHIKKVGMFVVPLRSEKTVLVALEVFSLERSTSEAFAVPFRVLGRKKYDRG